MVAKLIDEVVISRFSTSSLTNRQAREYNVLRFIILRVNSKHFYKRGKAMANDIIRRSTTAAGTSEQQAFLITQREKEQFIICDMCGYANPENTAICKKCSNYLEENKK